MHLNRIVTAALLALALLVAGNSYARPGQSFTLATGDGTEITLPDDQQGVGVYLFWASWCPYCQALMPHLQSVVDEYGDDVTVYALNFRDEKDPLEYIVQRGFDFMLFPGADGVAEAWGVRGTPAVYIIDPTGTVCFDRYELAIGNPPGWEEMSHRQKAQRRAPYWAARLRESLDDILSSGGC
ncbi:TlpA disulfide reductase family protein [Halomonas denitrificans]|nr:TlpA family protein disulfide reductase [Halomonas denitrificans]